MYIIHKLPPTPNKIKSTTGWITITLSLKSVCIKTLLFFVSDGNRMQPPCVTILYNFCQCHSWRISIPIHLYILLFISVTLVVYSVCKSVNSVEIGLNFIFSCLVMLAKGRNVFAFCLLLTIYISFSLTS